MKVKDFMITDVITVNDNTTVQDLLKVLVNNKIGGVPVVSENNYLLGVISDGDVIRYIQPKGRTIYDMFSLVLVSEKESLVDKLSYCMDCSVSKIMRTKDIFTLNPNDDLEDALTIFSKHRFKKIPVINEDKEIVGVISRGDVIRYIYNQLIQK